MSEMSAGRSLAFYAAEVGLTPKQRAFAEFYLSDPSQNKTLAAQKAGYLNPGVLGCKLIKSKKIQEFLSLAGKKAAQVVERKFNVAIMKPAEIKARLSDQARGSLVNYITPSGDLDIEAMRAEDKGHLLKRFKVTTRTGKDGQSERDVTADPADAQGALRELGSYYGMAKDKNSQLAPVNFISVVQSMEPGEKAALSKGLEHLYRAMLSTGQVTDIEAEEVE